MNLLSLKAVELARKLTRLYYCDRAVEDILAFLDPEITCFGCGGDEFGLRYGAIREHLKRAQEYIPPCKVKEEEYRLAAEFHDSCVVAGRFRLCTAEDSKTLFEARQRVTYVFRVAQGGLKVIHMHISNPCAELQKGEFFPEAAEKSTYEYLNRVIKKKTEQIEVMLGALTGGLKGSLDDEMYSYFYVSDELCAMLGYTKEEFLEASGGTAVGAVYPPDLPEALRQCRDCFLRGDNYEAEYRMQRKDGALIWVLDSGRKVKNNEGKTVINSIVLDITEKNGPMKKC